MELLIINKIRLIRIRAINTKDTGMIICIKRTKVPMPIMLAMM